MDNILALSDKEKNAYLNSNLWPTLHYVKVVGDSLKHCREPAVDIDAAL